MEIGVGGYIRTLLAIILIFFYTVHIFTVDIIYFIYLSLGQGRNPLFLFKILVSEGSI